MMRARLSTAAAGLMRAILTRAGVDRDRVLLIGWSSVDWQSLTFVGERHEVEFRLIGSDPERLARQIGDGLGDVEFTIAGQLVADITLRGPPLRQPDGSVVLAIEALTIGE